MQVRFIQSLLIGPFLVLLGGVERALRINVLGVDVKTSLGDCVGFLWIDAA